MASMHEKSNYVQTHIHSDYSLLDSATKYTDYIAKAVELGQTALATTEHGVTSNWVEKKQACNKAGLKFLFGVECYLTEKLEHIRAQDVSPFKIRDNYHTVLLAKNLDGIKEINRAISKSSDERHRFYKPRITFEDFLNFSDNVITTSACLASPLNLDNFNQIGEHIREQCGEEAYQEHLLWYDKLCARYDFFEVQPHYMSNEQAQFNEYLLGLSKKWDKPLICGCDVHSLDKYKHECRQILKEYSKIEYATEDSFDLTYHSYDEVYDMFKRQNVLSDAQIEECLHNTQMVADSIDDPELDTKTKYPDMGADAEDQFVKRVWSMYDNKVEKGIIPAEQAEPFKQRLEEEIRVFQKVGMCTFMLSMSKIISWCKENNIAIGPSRGSCGGSCVAYVTDITDLNPVQWNTIFSRFCNENRVEIGDIDVDIFKEDRPKVYQHIIDTFGEEKTAYVFAVGTIADKGTIDTIGGALAKRWKKKHPDEVDNPYSLDKIATIKEQYDNDPERCKADYPDIFYYFDGLVNVNKSQSMHPAGMIISPVNLSETYGTFYDTEGHKILCLDMDNSHDVGLAKYDILGLRTVGIIDRCCKLLNRPFLRSYEVNFNDKAVWEDMIKSPIGVFQFEDDYAFSLLKKFNTQSIEDMCLVTACVRPSGASYRDKLISRTPNKNPSQIIDDMLANNLGYLVYQEDTIRFLQEICGFSGSEADTVRRAIGHKDAQKLQEAIPKIMDGYCAKSDKPREIAEQEAKTFLQIIEDSSSYQFGYNHSVGYSILGYYCAYLRKYYPLEFITAFFNCSDTEEDFTNGAILAKERGIKIRSPKFRHSKADYFFDKESNSIYKGVMSIKYLSENVANELYELRDNQYNNFGECLIDISKTSINARQLDILIKLDFFSEFGNQRELLQIVNIFQRFKYGTSQQAKTAKKADYENDKVMGNIIARHSNGLTKSGKEAKTWTFEDLDAILVECSEYVLTLGLQDLGLKDKIANQMEYIGYIGITTDKPEDRAKIYVSDLRVMKSKDTGKPWGVCLKGQSLGSGKQTGYTVKYTTYNKDKIQNGDIIKILDWYKTQKGYFYITKYEKVIE